MDTAWIQVFREVARLGSFTAAAQVTGYTQSAVSRQVSALESEVGAVLFDRLPRGVRLTEAGRSLLGHAEAILERLATARADLAALHDLSAGRLRVGAVASASARLVPRALAEFRAAYPKISLTVQEGLSRALLSRVRTGDLDVAVVSDHAAQPLDAAGVELRRLVDDPMLVALPAGHPLATRRRLRLPDLADETWIAGSDRPEETLISSALRAGFRPRIQFVVAEWIAKLGYVAAGLGVTLVPAVAASGARTDVVLVPLHHDDAPVRTLHAAIAHGFIPPPAVEPFLQCLRSAVRE